MFRRRTECGLGGGSPCCLNCPVSSTGVSWTSEPGKVLVQEQCGRKNCIKNIKTHAQDKYVSVMHVHVDVNVTI